MPGGSASHHRVHRLTVPPDQSSQPAQRPVQPRGAQLRDLVALLLSVLLHLLPVLLGLIPALALRLLPKPPIEVEFLAPKPKAAPPPTPAPAPSPPAAEPPPKHAGTAPGAKPKPPRPVPAPSVQRLDLSKPRLGGLGPSSIDQDLGLRVLLRMPLLRSSPHRETIEALLHAFPDTHILAAGTALATLPVAQVPGQAAAPGGTATPGPMAKALLDDVDALFIATADPRDITATVFYATLRQDRPGSPSLADKLAQRKSPRWDTRTVTALRPELLAFARADLLGRVEAPPPGAPPAAPVASPPATDTAWIEPLLAALKGPGPALYAEILNVNQRIRLRSGLPTPVSIRLAVSADADPDLHVRVELATAEEAAQLFATLPGLQHEMSGRLFWLGLGGLLGGLKFQARGAAVEISGRLPRADTAVLLAWVRQFLPPPDRFLDPPPPPPPPLPTGPDGGSLEPPLDAGAYDQR